MYLNKYTATMMAAAMAALPGMFPAPSHGATGNEGAPEELTFVSLSPELYEIAPSSAITNPELLGDKTQLFYAKPKQEGETTTVARLSEEMILVPKRRGVPMSEEARNGLWYCWGRLDNLLGTSTNTMWARPSAAFMSVSHPASGEEKTPTGASKLELGKRYPVEHIITPVRDGKPKALQEVYSKIQLPDKTTTIYTIWPEPLSFVNCPWENMLQREEESLHGKSPNKDYEAADSDEKAVKDYISNLQTKNTKDKEKKWTRFGHTRPHWITYLESSLPLLSQASRQERGEWFFYWDKAVKVLNNPAGKTYKGLGEWLYLGDSELHRDDFKIESKLENSTIYHLLPISGGVTTGDKRNTRTTKDLTIAQAVILAPEDELFTSREAFLLGIMADWHSENAGNDALSLNTCCKPNGGHTHPVRIPEIANTDFANLHILRQEIPYLLPRITWVDKEGIGLLLIDRPQGGEAEVRWPNGAKKIKLSEGWCDPIAYQAGARNRQLKLIVALPSYQYASKSLNELGIGKRPTTGERYSYEWKLKCKAGETKAASHPQGGQDWASFTPSNYKVAFNRNPRFKIIPGAEDITVVRGDEEYPGYSLYEVTVTADTAINERITAGFMEHDWTFSLYNNGQPYTHNDSPIEFALHSEMPDVYTIFGPSTFGPSTWPDNGMISSTPETQQSAVLPWKDALDVLCKQILCDANSKRNEVKHNAAAKIVMEALHEGVSCVPVYPEDTKTHNRFAYENPTKTKSVATYKISLALSGGIVNKPMVCSDVACLFAILPRICGSTHIVEVKQRFNPTRPKDALDRRHTYNVYDGQNFDATPRTTKDLNSWESRKRKEEPGQIEKENPDCTYFGNFQILLDYVSKTKK